MRPDTHVIRNSLTIKAGLLFLFLLPLGSCRQEPEALPSGGIRIRIAPLYDYAWMDRSQSGQPTDMKPQEEREALFHELLSIPSEILILRGLGSEASLDHLQSALQVKGLDLPHTFYVPGPTPYAGIGFLSSKAFSETRKLSSHVFRIKEETFQPTAGGIRISTPSLASVWIWNQQAPSPEDGYERRRNESRILAQQLRPLIETGEEVILSLHSREEFDSPMFRMLEEAGLVRLVPEDTRGDSWTHRDPNGINYRQDQWIFVTPGLLGTLSDAQVFDSEDLRKAGPYRHQGLQLP